MRKLFILCFTLLAVSVSAQSIEAFKIKLADPKADSLSGTARVVVNEQADAARAIADAARASQRQRIRGYRVCIYLDNGQSGQNARAGAASAKGTFEANFPGIPVYMVYENPYFKVSAGNCLTAEEAIILKGRVSGIFPKAFLKREELALGDL